MSLRDIFTVLHAASMSLYFDGMNTFEVIDVRYDGREAAKSARYKINYSRAANGDCRHSRKRPARQLLNQRSLQRIC